MNRMMRWFTWTHLPLHLHEISAACGRLAEDVNTQLPESAEKTAGLRKLLEAKDCFVRAKIEAGDTQQETTTMADEPKDAQAHEPTDDLEAAYKRGYTTVEGKDAPEDTDFAQKVQGVTTVEQAELKGSQDAQAASRQKPKPS